MTRSTNSPSNSVAMTQGDGRAAPIDNTGARNRLEPTSNPLLPGFYDRKVVDVTLARTDRVRFEPGGLRPTSRHLSPREPLGLLLTIGSVGVGTFGALGTSFFLGGVISFGLEEMLTDEMYLPIIQLSTLLPIGFLGAIAARLRKRRERTARTINCPATLVDDVTATYHRLADASARIDLKRGRSPRQRALRGSPTRQNDTIEPAELLKASGRQRKRELDTLRQQPQTHAIDQHRRLVSHFISALTYANLPTASTETEIRDAEVRRRLAIIDKAITATMKDNHR